MIEERIERTFETGATAEVEISNVVGGHRGTGVGSARGSDHRR